MANVKGWAIDLKAVYGGRWEDRAKYHLSEDLWESPDGKLAGLLYGIAEVGVSKEVGRLAVFRNKERPELVLDIPHLRCWYLYSGGVQFGPGGLLFVHLFRDLGGAFETVPCALYPEGRCFAPVESIPTDFYDVRHEAGTRFRFTDTGSKGVGGFVADLKELRWRPLDPWRVLLDEFLALFRRRPA